MNKNKMMLITFIFALSSALSAQSFVRLPSSAGVSILLQSPSYGGKTIFTLASGETITKDSSPITGNNSRNWTFINRGSVTATAAGPSSAFVLGSIDGKSTVYNYGNITSAGTDSSAGVRFINGGEVYNYAGGYIEGFDALHTDGGSIYVFNEGTIHSTSATAIYSGEGALIHNMESGVITSDRYAVHMNGLKDGTVYNYGKIETEGSSLHLIGGGTYSVYNSKTGTITSNNSIPIFISGALGQVLNEGAVTSINDHAIESDSNNDIYVNSGTITAGGAAGVGILSNGDGNRIYNLGTISGSGTGEAVLINGNDTILVLGQNMHLPVRDIDVKGPGSTLNGVARSTGLNNSIILTDTGSEDSQLLGFDNLTMQGVNWTLDSALTLNGTGANALAANKGTLLLKNATNVAGGTTIDTGAALLIGDAGSAGATLTSAQDVIIAPGGSLGGTGQALANVKNYGYITGLQSITGNVENNGYIYLLKQPLGHTLTVNGDYTGGGKLYLKANLYANSAAQDALVINGGAATGSTAVFVYPQKGSGATVTQSGSIIKMAGAATSAPGSFYLASPVISGMSEFALRQNSTTQEWFLQNIGLHPEAGVYLGNAHAALSLLSQDFYDKNGTSGLRDKSYWGNISGNAIEVEAANGKTDINVNTMKAIAGVDLISREIFGYEDNARLGVMATYGQAWNEATVQGNSRRAHGEIFMGALGVYGTWTQQRDSALGAYVDLWLQYGYQENEIKGAVQRTKYHSQTLSASTEAGYNIAAAGPVNIVPHARAMWVTYQTNPFYADGLGSTIDDSGTSGWSTTLGTRFYGTFTSGKDNIWRPFAEFNWLYNDQNISVSFEQESITSQMSRNTAEGKFGLSWNRTDRVELWILGMAQLGEKSYQNFGGKFGGSFKI